MAGHSRTLIFFALQSFIFSVASIYHPNHKYDDESYILYDRETNKNELNHIHNFNQKSLNPSSNLVLSQKRGHLVLDLAANRSDTETRESNKKLMYSDDYQRSTKTSVVKSERKSYENFVTPRGKSSTKGYEVTTKRFKDSDREPVLAPSALGQDNDEAIALDDDDIVQHVEPVTSRPEHLNPLVYVDSYGRLRGEGQSLSGFGYGVVHPRTPHKASGRVRIQVFRGPTRTVGRKKYAPWGYYVVQPTDSYGYGPHRYPGPPYRR